MKKGVKFNWWYLFVSIILAFQLRGYYLFFERSVNATTWVVFVMLSLACYFVIKFCVLFFDWCGAKVVTHTNIDLRKRKYVWLSLFIIGGVAQLIMFVTYYPGIYSPDVVTCWEQAINIFEEKTDIHSFLYVCILAFFSLFTDNIAVVTFFFGLSFLVVFVSFMTFLWKKGISYRYILVATVLFYCLPNNLYLTAALWKDIPFTIGMMSLTWAMARWALAEDSANISKGCLLHVVISAICVACFRSNGMAVLAVLSIAFVFIWLRKHDEWKICIAVWMSLAFVLIYKGPVFDLLGVDRGPEGFACLPLVDAVWANAYYGVDLPDDMEQELGDIINQENWETLYDEGFANVYIWEDVYYNDKLSMGKSVEWYLWCLRNSPYYTIKARLTKNDFIWNYVMGESSYISWNCVFAAPQNAQADIYGWYLLEESQSLRNAFEDYHEMITSFPIVYRGAIYLSIWLILLVELLKKNKKIIPVLVPAICNAIALLIAVCYSDYRFIWNMEVLTFFIVPIYMLGTKRIARDGQINTQETVEN